MTNNGDHLATSMDFCCPPTWRTGERRTRLRRDHLTPPRRPDSGYLQRTLPWKPSGSGRSTKAFDSLPALDRACLVVEWVLIQALMWTVPVEMALVVDQHPAGVLLVVDQHPVGALGSDATHESAIIKVVGSGVDTFVALGIPRPGPAVQRRAAKRMAGPIDASFGAAGASALCRAKIRHTVCELVIRWRGR
jgi:hypothetical protein